MSPLTERTRSPEAATSAVTAVTAAASRFVRDVVADAGEGAQIDFVEAQAADGPQGRAGRSWWRKLMDEQPSRELNIVVDPLVVPGAVVMRTTLAEFDCQQSTSEVDC